MSGGAEGGGADEVGLDAEADGRWVPFLWGLIQVIVLVVSYVSQTRKVGCELTEQELLHLDIHSVMPLLRKSSCIGSKMLVTLHSMI